MKTKKTHQKESDLERICVQIASSYPNAYCWKVKASGQRHTFGGNSFFKKSTMPGFPDLLLCVKGLFVGVELKTVIGKQSDTQKICQENIEKSGGKYYIIRDEQSFKKLMDDYT